MNVAGTFRREIYVLFYGGKNSYSELDALQKMDVIKCYCLHREYRYVDLCNVLSFPEHAEMLFKLNKNMDQEIDLTVDSDEYIDRDFIKFVCRTYMNSLFVFTDFFLQTVERLADSIFEEYLYEVESQLNDHCSIRN